MTKLLDGVVAKVERADEHIRTLNTEIAVFVRENYRFVSESDHAGLQHTVNIVGPDVLPTRFGVITGEVVHQLRSGLDHLVTALYLTNGSSRVPQRDHQFPICDTLASYQAAVKNGMIRGVALSAAKLIDACQPYHYTERAEPIELNKLRVLRELAVAPS